MFKLSELVRWLGLSEFEIFTNLVALLIFTIILALRLAGHVNEETVDWFIVFSPLFCGDICNSYFNIIVGIRMHLDNEDKRKSLHRLVWSTKVLVLTGVFKYLLCLKLSGAQNLDYSEVFAPMFVLLQLIAVRACQCQIPNSS